MKYSEGNEAKRFDRFRGILLARIRSFALLSGAETILVVQLPTRRARSYNFFHLSTRHPSAFRSNFVNLFRLAINSKILLRLDGAAGKSLSSLRAEDIGKLCWLKISNEVNFKQFFSLIKNNSNNIYSYYYGLNDKLLK